MFTAIMFALSILTFCVMVNEIRRSYKEWDK